MIIINITNRLLKFIHTCIVGYFSIISQGSEVRPAFVRSINVSLYTGVLSGNVEDKVNMLEDFFSSVPEEISEALSGNVSSLSERYGSSLLFSKPFHVS